MPEGAHPLPSLDADLTRLHLIGTARAGGASWAAIGRALGKTGKAAKRDTKRLAKRTRIRAWQQENTAREAVTR
jgi:hypothetical protein